MAGTIMDVLPQDYGLVVGAVVLSGIGMARLGGQVMKARKECGVEYPNMYATVVNVKGEDYTNAKDAKAAHKFNCVQRGHQNALENHYVVLVLTLLGGLKHPVVAAASLTLWTVGASLYASNYACSGPSKRNKGLALTKYLGLFGLLGSALSLAYSLQTRA